MNTDQLRDAWYLYRCNWGVKTVMFGRSPVWAQNPDHVAALEAAHFAAGYVPTAGGFIGSKRLCPFGIGGRICQDNGDGCSTHNYGIGWDVEYNLNPNLKRPITRNELQRLFDEGVTKYTPEIVDTILAVTNLEGERLFTWLGYSIGDLMHWQLNVPPERQDVDWTTIGEQVDTHFRIGTRDPQWEPVMWLLYELEGGVIDPNLPSGQISTVFPWKTDVRLVETEDFDVVARIIGLSAGNTERLKTEGLYKEGKELAAVATRRHTHPVTGTAE